jgi:branched-chain amino acid transport system ATP-binding protein/urea transport system ATP-binding protein
MFENIDITSLPAYKIASLGIYYIPDYGGLLSGLTVLENLQLAANSKNIPVDELKSFYPEVVNLLTRRADALSGGERKIVSIIRSILTNAKLLLLDEPTEGMAPIMVDRTIKLLKKLNEEKGTSILWIEPGAKLKKVLEIANKVIILVTGRVVYVGEAEKAKKEVDEIKKYLFI